MLRRWPMPRGSANDCCKPSAGNRNAVDLTRASRLWMMATARDNQDGTTTRANTPVNGLHSRRVLMTPIAGNRAES